jgi:hypothetical protein
LEGVFDDVPVRDPRRGDRRAADVPAVELAALGWAGR